MLINLHVYFGHVIEYCPLLLGCGLIRSTPAPSEAPVMLQKCSLECSCSELSRGWGGSLTIYCLHC